MGHYNIYFPSKSVNQYWSVFNTDYRLQIVDWVKNADYRYKMQTGFKMQTGALIVESFDSQ